MQKDAQHETSLYALKICFLSICTKFAPKQKFEQKENPENLDGIGVF
jgi:hypothetical protein